MDRFHARKRLDDPSRLNEIRFLRLGPHRVDDIIAQPGLRERYVQIGADPVTLVARHIAVAQQVEQGLALAFEWQMPGQQHDGRRLRPEHMRHDPLHEQLVRRKSLNDSSEEQEMMFPESGFVLHLDISYPNERLSCLRVLPTSPAAADRQGTCENARVH